MEQLNVYKLRDKDRDKMKNHCSINTYSHEDQS